MNKTAKKIIVNLKFDRNADGKIVGFVTKYNGAWHGCRAEESRPKKIVLLDISLTDVVMPGVLYRVGLIPMREDRGFVAIRATPVQFDAFIETVFDGDIPHIEVKFGNKTIVYRPNSSMSKYSDIDRIASHILRRLDIRNVYEVTQNFLIAANTLKNYCLKTA
ncbi:hypothetical protein E5358_12610 [Palleniella muris]|uniref:Uncharacterized protein n=1 Tax=Palleniella muris TaxID=3038145 RepID=A0AC61QMK5_9BACT|nr:hypothetical protein [Palleniella muris]TGX80492.1 hypothetical protein E5358_12610 [Palleniella muris]